MGLHTVTIPRNKEIDNDSITAKALKAVSFSDKTLFHLSLLDSTPFYAEEIVRIIPGKRLVAFGKWQNKEVVAKLFFDRRSGRRHRDRDAEGVSKLKENKIPTASLYYQGVSQAGDCYVLIFERLIETKNLNDVWEKRSDTTSLLPLLRGVTIELATQHVLGILQHDLHLKNFLVGRKKIYTLDGAQIEIFPHLLPKKESMENLALFLSQLGVGEENVQEQLFYFYAKSRGWLLKENDKLDLFFAIKKWYTERWQRFEKKIFRNCSDFVELKQGRYEGMYSRSDASAEFMQIMNNPENAFTHLSMQPLKNGRASTVVKIRIDEKDFVVKRYNVKGVWHYLRRCLRPTRAAKSWRLAHKLRLLGVATPKPIAYLESRFLGLRGRSYLITEFVAGNSGNEYFDAQQNPEDISTMVNRIVELLRNLSKVNVTHGDLKITNIMLNEYNQPMLIDLDGANEHISLTGLRRAWRSEIKRFLRNFDSNPVLKEEFQRALMSK